MSNLKLVPPDGPTALEALLMNAVRSEAPSAEHKAQLRAALGLPLPFSSPVAAPAPAPSLAAPAAASGSPFLAAKVALGTAAVAVLGALAFTQLRTEPAEAGAPRAAVAVAPAAPAAPPVAPAAVPAAEPEVTLPAPLAVEAPVAPPVVRAPSRPAPSVADLGPQIKLIESARAGVAAGNAGVALRALDTYAAQFPRGSFGQEATVLRISAIEQSGDVARASAMAKAFLARHPASPHVARVKAIAERGGAR